MNPQIASNDLSEIDLVGRQVGKYRVTRILGRGGMGAVYEMIHEQIGQRAAIKVLFSKYAQDPEFVERFFHEAKVVNVIQHPGLVKVTDHGQLPDGKLYIVMEFLDGEPLRGLLARLAQENRRLESFALSAMFFQIIDTLQAVHDKGVIHRDLKPENIFLVKDPAVVGGIRAKILDFGIAKIQENSELRDNDSPGPLTTTGKILGTPTYMSPEQCEGRATLTPASDVYALGIILYELLSGTPPFTSGSGNAVMAMHMLKAPIPLSSGLGSLAVLANSMLAKNPVQRPSLAAVREGLSAYQARPHRTKLPRWVLLFGVIISAIGGGALFVAIRHTPAPRDQTRPAAGPDLRVAAPADMASGFSTPVSSHPAHLPTIGDAGAENPVDQAASAVPTSAVTAGVTPRVNLLPNQGKAVVPPASGGARPNKKAGARPHANAEKTPIAATPKPAPVDENLKVPIVE